MKTSDLIEQQEARKEARNGGGNAHSLRDNTPPVTPKHRRGDASRIAAWFWKPGQSGNSSGRPKHDLAAEIARAIFEQNADPLYQAYRKALLRGNAYCFKELSGRAYGKMPSALSTPASNFVARRRILCGNVLAPRSSGLP
jgi:hypothetical protein